MVPAGEFPSMAFGCGPDCGEPGDHPFHQYLVEIWLGEDRAILCDDDPAFPCRYTNMQTFEELSPDADGVPTLDRLFRDSGVGLAVEGPCAIDPATGVIEVGGKPVTELVIQWWYGETPTDSMLWLLTVSGSDLEELAQMLLETGEASVQGTSEPQP